MADTTNITLYKGARNIVVNMTDVSDGTGLTNVAIFTGSSVTPNPQGHLKVRRIRYSITNMLVTLIWDGGTPKTLAYLGQGEDILDWSKDFSGGLTNSAVTPNGNILISAATFGSATAGFTITLELLAGTQNPGQ